VRYDSFHDQMGSPALKENIDSLIFFDEAKRPFKLRVTFEEKEIFRWRIFQINVDAEFTTPSNTLETIHRYIRGRSH
jgi:hypothetical protein